MAIQSEAETGSQHLFEEATCSQDLSPPPAQGDNQVVATALLLAMHSQAIHCQHQNI